MPTVVRGVPTPAEVAVLQERHIGRIVTISFRDGTASQASEFLVLAEAGVGFELVYEGINDIQGRAFGHLTFALTRPDTIIDDALERIRLIIDVTEPGRGGEHDG